MRIITNSILLFCILITSNLWAQSVATVDSGSLSANERKVIDRIEGVPPMPFQAPDIEGNVHYLPDYKGHVTVIAFWSTTDDISRRQIASLNHLQKAFKEYGLKILSLANEEKPDLISFLKYHKVDYPIIPNAKPLGELGYADELGDTRIYVIDKKGMIQKVYVAREEKGLQTFNELKDIVGKLVKE